MSPTTREQALRKLAAFRTKIGYPDRWRDYSELAIERDAYCANHMRSNQFEFDHEISKVGQPTDRDEWA